MTTATLWQEIATHGVRSVIDRVTHDQAIALTERYGAHNYHPLPVNLVHGEGAKVWDAEGRLFYDGIGAYSAVAHGHLNPAVVRAANEQLEHLTLASRATYTPELAVFLQALCEYSELDMACPMCTGAEAVETCIKLARKWAYTVKGVPADRAKIIVCEGNFHGRTTTIVGFSSEPGYREGFGPFTPGFQVVPFGDLRALEAAIDENTAAFLAEPVQAEGGVIVPPSRWMAEVRRLCTERNVLLIWDEVQTGFCRTGKRFAWMHEGAKPDLMAVGKPLGGGLVPISAALGSREVVSVFRPGDHGSTFGGNSLACAVALAALAEMELGDYASRAEQLGRRVVEALTRAQLPQVEAIRALGLLIGVEVVPGVDTHRLSEEFLAQGLLTKETRQRTFRLTPPIQSSPEDVDEMVSRMIRAMRALGV